MRISRYFNPLEFVEDSEINGYPYKLNGGDGVIDDQGTGIVIFTVTCNEDGTAWEGAGTEVTQIECSAAE